MAQEDNSSNLLSDAQRQQPLADLASQDAVANGLLLLALQERMLAANSPLRVPATVVPTPTTTFPATNVGGLSAIAAAAGGLSAADPTTRLWQSVLLGLPMLSNMNTLDLSCLPGTSTMQHALWQHNLCAWPTCNQPCENFPVFLAHLSQAHQLDERGASQLKAQIELVEGLEHRLTKERSRLQAMMQHLHMKQSPDTTTPSLGKVEPASPLASPKVEMPSLTAVTSSTSQAPIQTPLCSSMTVCVAESAPLTAPHTPTAMVSAAPASSCEASPNTEQKPFVPRRSRISDKTVLPISADIARNREFYRANDVRPPYTYASLIRQAIMESADSQLTLNEIYTWFTDTFAYFRRNAATWKNAVRHNLSLHKCFQRVEQSVKGAVWTVDDSEFYRRRPQRTTTTSRSQPQTPLPDEMLAQRLLDQTALSMFEQQGASADGVALNGGLEGVLSLLANSGDMNPLSILSAAAAVSERSSRVATPLIVKDEAIEVDVPAYSSAERLAAFAQLNNGRTEEEVMAELILQQQQQQQQQQGGSSAAF